MMWRGGQMYPTCIFKRFVGRGNYFWAYPPLVLRYFSLLSIYSVDTCNTSLILAFGNLEIFIYTTYVRGES